MTACALQQVSRDSSFTQDAPREHNLYVKNLPMCMDDDALRAMFQVRFSMLQSGPCAELGDAMCRVAATKRQCSSPQSHVPR